MARSINRFAGTVLAASLAALVAPQAGCRDPVAPPCSMPLEPAVQRDGDAVVVVVIPAPDLADGGASPDGELDAGLGYVEGDAGDIIVQQPLDASAPCARACQRMAAQRCEESLPTKARSGQAAESCAALCDRAIASGHPMPTACLSTATTLTKVRACGVRCRQVPRVVSRAGLVPPEARLVPRNAG